MKGLLPLLVGVALVSAAAAYAVTKVPTGTQVMNQANSFVSVSPSDTVNLTVFPTRGVSVGGTAGGAACDLAIIGSSDTSSIIMPNLQPGSDHPYQVKRILSTGTTCVSVRALY